MAHLTSRHKLTIDISNAVPTTSAEVFDHIYAIQGPTDVLFVLSGIDLGSIGIYDFTVDYGDGSNIKNIEPLFIDRLPTKLSLSAVEHTFYLTTSASSEITAQIVNRYLSVAGATPSIVTHNIKFKQSAGNSIDKNLEILNTQLFTISAESVPLMNLESDENTIYPCAFLEVGEVIGVDDNIYINTDPEAIDLDAQYLYRTAVKFEPDLTTFGLSALSGSGFTLQGKSGKLYTAVFGISGEDLRYTYTQNTTSIVLSADINIYLGISDVQQKITTLFINNGLVGSEFSLISTSGDSIYFYQSNQLPPEATVYTYTTSVSTTIPPAGGYTPYSSVDNIYSYTVNPYGPSGITGLSAVNRMKTDPNGLLIRAL